MRNKSLLVVASSEAAAINHMKDLGIFIEETSVYDYWSYVNSRASFYTEDVLELALAPCCTKYRDWAFVKSRIDSGNAIVVGEMQMKRIPEHAEA